jgi:hypothetical protein
MAQSGVSGLDLYVRTDHGWEWMESAGATAREGNTRTLFSGVERKPREFLLYLPLYNRIESLRLGVPPNSTVETRVRTSRPLVFYGTSIVQGGCVSRPGTAYPALLGRWLDRPIVNLGFSGNGNAEPEVAALVAEIDAAVFILDPLPNLTPDEVARVGPFIAILRAKHPRTPVVVVECLPYPDGAFISLRRAAYKVSNLNLGAPFDRLHRSERNLDLIPSTDLIGVDGVHPTYLGVFRIAGHMEGHLRAVLGDTKAGVESGQPPAPDGDRDSGRAIRGWN